MNTNVPVNTTVNASVNPASSAVAKDAIGVCVLGSTGSIGCSVLDVIQRHPQYKIDALVAGRKWESLLQQIRTFKPRVAILDDAEAAGKLAIAVAQESLETEIDTGVAAVREAVTAPQSSTVVAGIVGAAGLDSSLAAVAAGKKLLLANKEPMVMCGSLIQSMAHSSGAVILPLDSEHNAIFQSLPAAVQAGQCSAADAGVTAMVLTASGGPFRGMSRQQLEGVTTSQALAHPNWEMGPKISIDSATMMNKGLEVLEASYLFNVAAAEIEVVVHPQSVIHSMVRYRDGSVLAQLGNPDMRTPIAHALAWPDRIDSGVEPIDFVKYATLTFEAPDLDAFPCLRLAYEAAERGGTATTALNAANEVAVGYLLDERVAFLQLPDIVESVLAQADWSLADDLATILQADEQAREITHRIVTNL